MREIGQSKKKVGKREEWENWENIKKSKKVQKYKFFLKIVGKVGNGKQWETAEEGKTGT